MVASERSHFLKAPSKLSSFTEDEQDGESSASSEDRSKSVGTFIAIQLPPKLQTELIRFHLAAGRTGPLQAGTAGNRLIQSGVRITHSYLLTHSLTHSYLLTHSLTHLLTHSTTHSLTQTPSLPIQVLVADSSKQSTYNTSVFLKRTDSNFNDGPRGVGLAYLAVVVGGIMVPRQLKISDESGTRVSAAMENRCGLSESIFLWVYNKLTKRWRNTFMEVEPR